MIIKKMVRNLSLIRIFDRLSVSSSFRFRPNLEAFEDRTLPSVTLMPTYVMNHASHVNPLAGSGISGYTPAQIQKAYGFSGITFANGTVTGNGSGQTIAIVDAYDDPNIAADLATFDKQFSLAAPPSFTKIGINSQGIASTTQFPSGDSGWATEISLDVEWAHAVAPGAKILLVEAHSADLNDLLNAVNYARNASGVSVVSMSWGEGEFSGQTSDDSTFTTPANHNGVSFVASSGDSGSPSIWPALSTNVIAVGGTSLQLSGSTYQGETGWSGSGGSLSSYEKEPTYQQGLTIYNGSAIISANGHRAGPDVAYDADPNTGYAIYDTYASGGWMDVGGTSAGAPQWAGLIAIANQGRVASGLATLDGPTQTLPDLYKLASGDFHSITSGSNGGYSAGNGYNLVTGLGSPIANLVVQGLIGTTTTGGPGGSGSGGGSGGTSPETLTVTASLGSQTATSAILQATGVDSQASASSLSYIWSLTSGPAGATVQYSANGSNAASKTTATVSSAGTYSFLVTAVDPAGIQATASVTVTFTSVLTTVAVTPASVTLSPGSTSTLSALALDQFGNPIPTSIGWSLKSSGSGVSLSSTGVLTATASASGTFQAVASATVNGTTLTGTSSVTIGPPVLFQDNFSSGGGNWTVTSGYGDYYIVKTSAGPRLEVVDFNYNNVSRVVAGSSSWTNYSYQATLNFNANTYGSVSLTARETDNTHLYFFGYNVSLGEWMIAIRNGSVVNILATSAPMTVYANEDYLVQANLSGSSLSLDVNNTLVASATDGTFSHGMIGFTATEGAGLLGNVLVSSLSGPNVLKAPAGGAQVLAGIGNSTASSNNSTLISEFTSWVSNYQGVIDYFSLPEGFSHHRFNGHGG